MLKGIVEKRINRQQIFDIHHGGDVSLVHVLVFLSRAAQLSRDLLDSGDATTHSAFVEITKSDEFERNFIFSSLNRYYESYLEIYCLQKLFSYSKPNPTFPWDHRRYQAFPVSQVSSPHPST